MAIRRRGIEHIHPESELIPFKFISPTYGVYKENLKEWANENFVSKRFPKKGYISEEEKAKIKLFFERRKNEFPEGSSFLIPLLSDLKENFGVIYIEYMEEISKLSEFSPAFILGVATFYTMLEGFDGKAEIYVCNSLPCHLKGSEEILKKLREKAEGKEVEVREWVCLGRCEFAPVVHIPYTEKSFGEVKEEDLERIIQTALEVCPWRKNKK